MAKNSKPTPKQTKAEIKKSAQLELANQRERLIEEVNRTHVRRQIAGLAPLTDSELLDLIRPKP